MRKNRLRHFILGVLLFWFNSFNLYASVPLTLADSTEELSVTRQFVEVLEDPSTRLTFEEIRKIPSDGQKFKISTAQDLLNSRTSSAYWLKFYIINPSQNQNIFIIELFDFDIDEISLYVPDKYGSYKEEKAGFNTNFASRKIVHKNVAFPIEFKSDVPVAVYMRFKSEKLNLMEPIIRSYSKFINYGLKEYILLGIFYGLLLLVILYNLLYFIILRKRYYIYFVTYATAALLYFLSINGIGFQYIWSNLPFLNHYMPCFCLFIGSMAMVKFFSDFFDLKNTAFIHYNILRVMLYFRLLLFALQAFFPLKESICLIDLIYYEALFLLGIRIYKYGNDSAKWIVIAYSVLNFAGAISFLENITIIPSNIFTVYVINAGIILQLVFLSIGIAEKVRQLYREKNIVQANLIHQLEQNDLLREKVNRELEERVKERTFELQLAKQELEKRAEENMKINIALDLANNKLQKHLSSFAQTVVTSTHVDFETFKKAYPDDLSCMRHIFELKEKNGFCCKMCNNTRSIKGKGKFDVRCSKCNYNESLTANTIFHRTKFSLQKAFYMLYLISQTKTDISAAELARILDLQNITCQNFKNKILVRMKAGKKVNRNKEIEWELLILDKDFVV